MALIIHNYMLKKNYNNNRNYSYRIKEYFEKQNDSLCILAKDNNEAKYLFNELKLFIDNDLIQYFPDNELLPYDHFSIPESLVKKRFQIINSNIESKNIVESDEEPTKEVETSTSSDDETSDDEDEFKNYLSDQENIEPLANEEIQARKMGINSVPTFIVNKQIVINGAQTSENFELIFQKLTNNIH